MKKLLRFIWHKTIGPRINAIRFQKNVNRYEKSLPDLLSKIRKKPKIKVVFFVINVGMWKSDGLYKLLQDNKRFEPVVISYLLPTDTEKYKIYVQNTLRDYFQNKGYQYFDMYNPNTGKWLDINEISPDIVFYTQPYDNGYDEYKIKSLWKKCIFIYIPYCYQMELITSYHNLLLQNISWRMFYPTNMHKAMAEKYAYNRGKNIVITGYPLADTLISKRREEWKGWKQKESKIKRVIWAPHHSIRNDSTLHCSNFLDMAEGMLQIAKEYKGRIQFAFKPHPRLINQLQELPEWGVERAENYYQEWSIMDNSIFVEGEYLDLFKSSDAMVHDCSSFMGEYLYTKKPVMFIAKDTVTELMNEFGKACFSQHYIGKTLNDIRNFLDKVVLGGGDPMLKQREAFFIENLLPPNGKTTSENMYSEMEKLL